MKPSRWELFSILLLGVMIYLCAGTAQAEYSGGLGTAEQPWRISTPNDLDTLSKTPGHWGGSFVQLLDIDMKGHDPIGPIGAFDVQFTGTYQGAGFRILNLIILSANQAQPGGDGLFGLVAGTGVDPVIQCLIIENPTVMGASADTGGLVGRLESGTVQWCGVKGGYVSGTTRTGGLVGTNVAGLVSQCYSTTMVEGTSYCGGLVGENLDGGTVMDCYATGRVIMRPLCLLDQGYRAGGLIGVSRGGVSTCYAASAVSLLPASNGACAGCSGGLMGAVIPGSVPFSSVFANVCSAALSDEAVGCGTLSSGGAQAVSSEALTQKDTFRYWDLDTVWYIPAGGTPRLRWQNHQPVAVPGADQTVTIPSGQAKATVLLDGSESHDPDGDPLTYRWVLSNAASSGATPSLVLAQGVYVVTLVVNDGVADSAPQTVKVTVGSNPNRPPVAAAGADLVLSDDGTGHQTATLDGSASHDPEGSVLTYRWTWSGGTATGAKPTVDLPIGEHEISLVVNDGTQDSNTADTVKVSVVASLKVAGVCSPDVIGRRSTIGIDDICFNLALPQAVKEARASNVDSKVPIQVFITPGGQSITATQKRDGYNNLTLVASVTRKGVLNAIGANGKVSLRVLVRLTTGRYIESTVTAEIVAGPGPSWVEVLFERIGWFMKYGG